jgi:hypothetical protein
MSEAFQNKTPIQYRSDPTLIALTTKSHGERMAGGGQRRRMLGVAFLE